MATGPFAVERAAERIDDAAEQRRPHRHAHDIAGAVHRVAGLDRIHIVKQDAADSAALKHLGEAELTLVETQQLVEPNGGKSGYKRNAVPDLFHSADLLTCAARASWRRALRERVRAKRPPGVSGSFVIREVRKDFGEIGAPTVGDGEVRAVQFKTRDQSGIHLEG